MFRSIQSRLIVTVIFMAALLGTSIYYSSVRLDEVERTLDTLEAQQEFKSHVLIPQKDMNQFLAAIENTVLFVELGDAEGAQEAYNGSVDAEQDISAEFAMLEAQGQGELLEMSEKAHADWESATEFLKIQAETIAAEKGIKLARPSTEPTKTVDEHTSGAVTLVSNEYGSLNSAQLQAIADDSAASPVELADNGIDGLEDATDEVLAAEKAAGEATLKSARQTIVWAAIAVLVVIMITGMGVTYTVSRPLSSLKRGAEKIADGDLDYAFGKVSADEVGDVIHAVERMSGSLKNRIRNLEETAGIVLLTSDEIAAAARELEPGPAVSSIVAKSGTLKDLVGQMLIATKS